MKQYLTKKDKYSNAESQFINGEWKTRYFHLFCDLCGAKHPDICVNADPEGYPPGDYCWNCQMSMAAQGFYRGLL